MAPDMMPVQNNRVPLTYEVAVGGFTFADHEGPAYLTGPDAPPVVAAFMAVFEHATPSQEVLEQIGAAKSIGPDDMVYSRRVGFSYCAPRDLGQFSFKRGRDLARRRALANERVANFLWYKSHGKFPAEMYLLNYGLLAGLSDAPKWFKRCLELVKAGELRIVVGGRDPLQKTNHVLNRSALIPLLFPRGAR